MGCLLPWLVLTIPVLQDYSTFTPGGDGGHLNCCLSHKTELRNTYFDDSISRMRVVKALPSG